MIHIKKTTTDCQTEDDSSDEGDSILAITDLDDFSPMTQSTSPSYQSFSDSSISDQSMLDQSAIMQQAVIQEVDIRTSQPSAVCQLASAVVPTQVRYIKFSDL